MRVHSVTARGPGSPEATPSANRPERSTRRPCAPADEASAGGVRIAAPAAAERARNWRRECIGGRTSLLAWTAAAYPAPRSACQRAVNGRDRRCPRCRVAIVVTTTSIELTDLVLLRGRYGSADHRLRCR